MKTPKGFRCPHCQSNKIKVVDTVRILPQVVRRYRKCGACEKRFITEERVCKSKESYMYDGVS